MARIESSSFRDFNLNIKYSEPETPALQTSSPKIRFDSAYSLNEAITQSKFYIERPNVTATIHAELEKVGILAIYALGGVGKTSVALSYAESAIKNKSYDHVLWLGADDEETLLNRFREIAEELGLEMGTSVDSTGSTDRHKYKKAVLEWLEDTQSGNWLLVYDNVDEPEDRATNNTDWLSSTQSIPRGSKGKIIITSRSGKWETWAREEQIIKGRALSAYKLPCFENNESVEFLEKRINQKFNEGERRIAEELSNKLGHLPLALEQAGAFISQSEGYSIKNYFDLFEISQNHTKFLDEASPSGTYRHRNVALNTTWKINFDAVKQRDIGASQLLTIASFLAPDDIPYEIFIKGGKYLKGELAQRLNDPSENLEEEQKELLKDKELVKMLTSLDAFSLVSWRGADRNKKRFSIHRLVQDVARLVYLDRQERREIISPLLSCLQHSLLRAWVFNSPWSPSEDWWVEQDILDSMIRAFPHIREVLKHGEAEQIVEAMPTAEVAFRLYGFLGDYLEALHSHEEAIQEGYNKAEKIIAQIYTESGLEHIVFGIRKAKVLKELRNYEEALALLTKILDYTANVQIEERDFYKAFISKEIGRIYQVQGFYEKADKHYKEVKTIFDKVKDLENFQFIQGERDVNGLTKWDYLLAATANSRGNNYRFWKRYEDAISEYKYSTSQYFCIGKNHLGYLRGCYNLAKAYAGNGEYVKAKEILERVYKTRREKFQLEEENDKHFDIISSLAALGTLYRDWLKSGTVDQKCNEELQNKALEYLERAFRASVELVGLTNPDIEPSANNLFSIYKQLNLLNDWRSVLNDLKEACEAQLELDSKPSHLGFVYREIGNYFQAFARYHEDTTSKAEIDNYYYEAQQYFLKAAQTELRLRKGLVKPIKAALSGLERVSKKIEEFSIPITALEEAIENHDFIDGVKAELYGFLGSFRLKLAYQRKGTPERKKLERDALEAYKIACHSAVSFYGEYSIKTADLHKDLGNAYAQQRKFADALREFRKAEKFYENIHEDSLPTNEHERRNKQLNYIKARIKDVNNKNHWDAGTRRNGKANSQRNSATRKRSTKPKPKPKQK